MTTQYEFTLCSPTGIAVAKLPVLSLEYARKEMEIGTAKLVLGGNSIDYRSLVRDMILTIERSVDGRPAYLAGGCLWFLRHKSLSVSPHNNQISLIFEDPITLLNRRIIAYYSDLSETDKTAAADDIMKAIVRENMGSSATDTDRSIATYLLVQADQSLGQSVEWASPWSNVLDEIKKLAEASLNLGTYLTFDVETVYPPILGTSPIFQLQFSVYKTMRGIDHTTTTGTNPVLIGPEYGNMSDITIDDDWTRESNHLYVGGEGDDSDRLLVEVSNTAVEGAGPLSRFEEFVDHSDLYVSEDLTQAGNADLAHKITKTKISGSLKDSEGVKYGVNINYGDYVTAQVWGYSVDCRLTTEHVTWEPQSGEALDIRLEGTLP